jgi:hypothetical protein
MEKQINIDNLKKKIIKMTDVDLIHKINTRTYKGIYKIKMITQIQYACRKINMGKEKFD